MFWKQWKQNRDQKASGSSASSSAANQKGVPHATVILSMDDGYGRAVASDTGAAAWGTLSPDSSMTTDWPLEPRQPGEGQIREGHVQPGEGHAHRNIMGVNIPPPGGGGRAPPDSRGYDEMAVIDIAATARRRLAHGSSISLMAGSKASFRLGLDGVALGRHGSNALASPKPGSSSFSAESFVILGSSGRLLARQQSRAKPGGGCMQSTSTVRSPLGLANSRPPESGANRGEPASPSPWGAATAAAALGDVPAPSPGAEQGLVSPWGAALAATALGLEPEPAHKSDSASLVSPWGALLAAAALGLPSVDAPSVSGSEAKAHKSSASGFKPAASGSTSGQHSSSRAPMSVTVPMVSELLLPFHPTDAPPAGIGITGGGGGGGTFSRASASGLSFAGQQAASQVFMGSGPLPKMSMGGNPSASTLGGPSVNLNPRVFSRSSNGSLPPYGSPPTSGVLPTAFGSPPPLSGPSFQPSVPGSSTPFALAPAVVDPSRTSDSSASASFASPSITMSSGASTLQHKMTGRLATVEPNPSIRFELDWAT